MTQKTFFRLLALVFVLYGAFRAYEAPSPTEAVTFIAFAVIAALLAVWLGPKISLKDNSNDKR